MKKSATDVMQDIVFAAAIDAVVALKTASKGMPNTLLRDLNAIHANTTQADLPPELQAAIAANVRAAFARLLKEGYTVAPAGAGTQPQRPQRHVDRKPGGRPSGPPRNPGPRGGKDPGGPRRPDRKPPPR